MLCLSLDAASLEDGRALKFNELPLSNSHVRGEGILLDSYLILISSAMTIHSSTSPSHYSREVLNMDDEMVE